MVAGIDRNYLQGRSSSHGRRLKERIRQAFRWLGEQKEPGHQENEQDQAAGDGTEDVGMP